MLITLPHTSLVWRNVKKGHTDFDVCCRPSAHSVLWAALPTAWGFLSLSCWSITSYLIISNTLRNDSPSGSGWNQWYPEWPVLPGLPRTYQVLALNTTYPGDSLSPGQTEIPGYPETLWPIPTPPSLSKACQNQEYQELEWKSSSVANMDLISLGLISSAVHTAMVADTCPDDQKFKVILSYVVSGQTQHLRYLGSLQWCLLW